MRTDEATLIKAVRTDKVTSTPTTSEKAFVALNLARLSGHFCSDPRTRSARQRLPKLSRTSKQLRLTSSRRNAKVSGDDQTPPACALRRLVGSQRTEPGCWLATEGAVVKRHVELRSPQCVLVDARRNVVNRVVDFAAKWPLVFAHQLVIDGHAPGWCKLRNRQRHRLAVVAQPGAGDVERSFVVMIRTVVGRATQVPGTNSIIGRVAGR